MNNVNKVAERVTGDWLKTRWTGKSILRFSGLLGKKMREYRKKSVAIFHHCNFHPHNDLFTIGKKVNNY